MILSCSTRHGGKSAARASRVLPVKARARSARASSEPPAWERRKQGAKGSVSKVRAQAGTAVSSWRIAKTPVSAGTLSTVFAVGVPGLAIAALAGGMITEPHQQRFLADALVATVVFAGCAVLALAIARLTAVGNGDVHALPLQADLDGHGDHRIVVDHQDAWQWGFLR